MLTPPFDFDAIMAPIGAARFFVEYEGKQPLHLKGAADKFAAVMTWDKLNTMLGMGSIWSQKSLALFLDKKPVPLPEYCGPDVSRDGVAIQRPDAAKVQAFLRRGATLIANDIDQLLPDLNAFAGTLETALGGKVQGNLYCSSRRRQGFAAHYDTHDVYAVHVEGTKTWHVYEGQADAPIAHPMFKSQTEAHHEQAKGALMMTVKMEPGDLLYLPRGRYHDALADDGGAVHIAFGVTYPIGIDVLSLLYEQMVAEPVFRANLPRPAQPDYAERMGERLLDFAEKIGAQLAAAKTLAQMRRVQEGFRYPRATYELPALFAAPADEAYRVRADGVRLVEQGGRFGLVRVGTKRAVEVPAEVSRMVGWILDQSRFSQGDLARAFPDASGAIRAKLVRDLAAMRLLEAI